MDEDEVYSTDIEDLPDSNGEEIDEVPTQPKPILKGGKKKGSFLDSFKDLIVLTVIVLILLFVISSGYLGNIVKMMPYVGNFAESAFSLNVISSLIGALVFFITGYFVLQK